MLVLQKMSHTDPPEYNVPSWSTGTDAEIKEALKRHYKGQINLYEYWNIGLDERVVPLSAMTDTTYTPETHVAQTVTLVLMDKDIKELVTPINGHTKCAFVVGQKNVLVNNGTAEEGIISSQSNQYRWYDGDSDSSGKITSLCERSLWCDNVYKNALPSTLVDIFKRFKNYFELSGHTEYVGNLFALPSEKEVFGTNEYSNVTIEQYDRQFDYYKTSINRIKYCGDNSEQAAHYWTRSAGTQVPYNAYVQSYNESSYKGTESAQAYCYYEYAGIAPFGVI